MRLVPYHCLGSLWSQRDKKGREGVCWSVRATIRQFNKLANTVLASCLCPTKLRSHQRAQLLEKWINVAEVSNVENSCSLSFHRVKGFIRNARKPRRIWRAVEEYQQLRDLPENTHITYLALCCYGNSFFLHKPA